MKTYFEQLAANVRLIDLLDILVVAFLLYCCLSWLRPRMSRSVVIGMAGMAALFLCASWLDMYLVTRLLQGGLLVMLMALVLVFQQDIRRIFDRLDVFGRFWGNARSAISSKDVIDTLTEAVASLAANRTGALLVFPRDEPLDRHIRGGVAVRGLISLPLLSSIFDSHSAGHDGAVTIDGRQIDRLGVHLPLTKNLSAIGSGGTRHAAALGLAECSDALILVVSEERGDISVAEHGVIQQVQPADLASRLAEYYRDQSEPKGELAWHRFLTHNLGVKFASLAIACALWLFFASGVDTIQRTYVIPIEYRNLPENWVVEQPRPGYAELTLSGSERAFDLLDASTLGVSFDLSDVRSGVPYTLRTEEEVKNVPKEFSVNQIRPRAVTITVQRNTDEDS